jgi:HlyB family type I secretion system ABC transporter
MSERGVLNELPILRFLPDDARALVVRSFVPASFGFGAVIVAEGQPTEAIYVIVSGRARVLKRGEQGDEIPLNMLRAGDSFGELDLLQKLPSPTTVRASGDVLALRLDRGVFEALLEVHPDIRTYLELQIKHRTLQGFFRDFPAFARLPADAVLGIVLADLEPLIVEAGNAVFRQGDASGPLYLIEEGRVRIFRIEAGRREHVAHLGPGEFFGEASVFLGAPRQTTAEASSRCRLLTLNEETFGRLVSALPDFRARMEERIARYDYKTRADVPDDIEQELLPASAAARPAVDGSQVDAGPAAQDDGDAPFGDRGYFRKRRRRIRRMPLVRQIDEMDCGAASLAMVCRQFGRQVPLARIRQLVNTGIDGTSLRALCTAGEELGLAARAVKASPRHLDAMPLPAVVHWDADHWIVLYDVGPKAVRVADPALGHRTIPRDEFERRWSGYAALFDYTQAFEAAPVSGSSMAWLWPLMRTYRGVLLQALGLAVIVSALQMVLPIFTQVMVDRVLVDQNVGLLDLLFVGMGLTMLFMMLSLGAQRYLLSFAAVRIDAAALDFVTRRLLSLPLSYFSTRRTGDIQRRLDGMREIRDFTVQEGIGAVMSLAMLAASLTLMTVYSASLTLVFLLTAPLYLLLMLASFRFLRPTFQGLEEAYSKYHSYQIDAIKGIETVKAMGGESAFRELMVAQFQSVAQKTFRADFTVLSYEGAIQAVTFLTGALFLWAGAHQVMSGAMTIGGLVAFNSLVAMSTGPLRALLGTWDNLQRGAVLLDRLNDVLEHEPEQGADRSQLRPVRALEGHVSFRNLGFRYGGPEAPAILDGITLDVPAGRIVAIVGRSGSGKTTLAKCLAGLLEPTTGTILFDGADMKTLNYRELRRQIGFVLQENYLFSDTIARNIAFGEEDPDFERVQWAARVASAHEFIERLPLGYDTKIGESGLAISGGQRQRVAIARAVYHKPPILLFDEATSALDTESERSVKQNIDELLRGRTAFIIAHRLSTVQNADLILVLERGRLVEHGTHEELLKRQGLYYYLSSQQLAVAS